MRYMHLYDYMTVCNVISILPSLLERCSYTVTEHAFWSSFVFVAPCSGTLLFSFSWFFLGAKTIQSFWLQMNMWHLDPFGTGVAVVHMTCSGWNVVESALLFHFFSNASMDVEKGISKINWGYYSSCCWPSSHLGFVGCIEGSCLKPL